VPQTAFGQFWLMRVGSGGKVWQVERRSIYKVLRTAVIALPEGAS
jgi:hypothetical protein